MEQNCNKNQQNLSPSEEIICQSVTPNKGARIWEVDFVRGICIIGVVFSHLFFDLGFLFSASEFNSDLGRFLQQLGEDVYTGRGFLGQLRDILHLPLLVTFALLLGVSCTFTQNSLKRALKLTVVAIAFSLLMAVGQVVADSMGMSVVMTSNFNILHVFALCLLLYTVVERLPVKGIWIFAFALVAIVVGCYFINNPSTMGKWGYWLVNSYDGTVYSPADYVPLLPYFGWFLLGVLFGKKHYKDRNSLFPNVKTNRCKPILWCGSRSLYIYFISQIALAVVLWALVELFGIL